MMEIAFMIELVVVKYNVAEVILYNHVPTVPFYCI